VTATARPRRETAEPDAAPRARTEWAVPPTPSALSRWTARRAWGPPAALGAILAAGTAYTAWQDPNQGGGLFPGCPLHEMTGLDCPGCGGTRALHALTQGDIGAAVSHNAVLAVLLPLAALAWAAWMVHALRVTWARRQDRPPPRWPDALRIRVTTPGWVAMIAVLLAFAVVRNISAVPVFEYLASEA
jgi:hypothetical protein